MPTQPSSRFAGLDGLRAIAVILVVIYHLFPGLWLLNGLPGGFLGVDIFFVISGFLITSLLLRERSATGTIALGDFWRRRARRLLPPLVIVVTVCATAAWLIGGDVLVGLGRQVLGAATFSYNWVAIAAGTSYFSAGLPEIFRNIWSLAVEEQFYLVWPLVLPLFLLLPRRWMRIGAAGLLALGSAAWAAVLLSGTGDVTRVYYGTDAHAFGLLVGVALAFALQSARSGAPSPATRLVSPRWGLAIGALAVAGLIALSVLTPGSGVETFPGLLVTASLLTAVVIFVSVLPGSLIGRALDVAPMRWVGERSYGIYLWHWPVLVLLIAATTGATPDAGVPVPLALIALAVTLGASALSYRFVEQPIRRLGLRGLARAVARRLRSTPMRRFSAIASLAAGVLVIGGTTAAVAAAPPVTSSEAVVQAGRDALQSTHGGSHADGGAGGAEVAEGDRGGGGDDRASGVRAPTPAPADAQPTGAACPTRVLPRPQVPGSGAACPPGADGSPVRPVPASVSGDRITAVGDSVMLASAPGLLDALPGIVVDAEVSRSMWAGPKILRSLQASGDLRDYVVVALGTNGPVDSGALEDIYDIVGPDRCLVLVNAFAPRDWIAGVNTDLQHFADTHRGVVVADWSDAIDGHTDLLAGDRIHPGAAGGRVFAQTIASAVDGVENQRAELTYQIERMQWAAGEALSREKPRSR